MNHRSGSGGIQVGKEQEKKAPRKPGLFEGVLTLHSDLEGVKTVPWRAGMQSALGITWLF